MKYAIDPEILPWLSMIPTHDPTDLIGLRELQQKLGTRSTYTPPMPVETRNILVPSLSDSEPEIPVRVYTPQGGQGLLPGLVYFHGGGFIMGNVDMFDNEVTRIAAEVGTVVVSVEYRLAPEDPYPAGVEDCYAALTWTASSVGELGIDPMRLAVGGGSAGGGLAAAVALLARDRGGPHLCFQFLGLPELDDRLQTPSMSAYDDTPMWTREGAVFSWESYLGAGIRGTDAVSSYAAPARAADLTGLPPAFITVCQFDPLRDEGIDYAQRLAQANVPTDLILYAGTFHGSTIVEQSAVSRRQVNDLLSGLRRGLRV